MIVRSTHIRRCWRTFCILLSALTVACVLGLSSSASAGYYSWVWTPIGVGCARSISVGPNGHPWILGCPNGNPEGKGPAWVYYLTWSRPAGSLFDIYQWNYDNFSAMTLYVNVNGWPFATDETEAVYTDTGNNGSGNTGYWELPSGVWARVANPAAGAIAASVETSVLMPAGEMFYAAQYFDYWGNPQGVSDGNVNLWTIGCGSNCKNGPLTGVDSSIWVMQSTNVIEEPAGMTAWARLPGGAVTITMITKPGGISPYGVDTRQTPWVLNASGEVYRWSANSGNNAEYPPEGQWVKVLTPEPAVWITEQGLLGQSGETYYCDTDAPVNYGDWYELIPPNVYGVPTSPIHLKQIAAGGSITATVIGGPTWQYIMTPNFWGLDYQGNVYQAQYVYIQSPAQ